MRKCFPKAIIKVKVTWFAEIMKGELEKHLDRPGWKDETTEWLCERLDEEVKELKQAVRNNESDQEVIEECADVGNFAMMIADNYERK